MQDNIQDNLDNQENQEVEAAYRRALAFLSSRTKFGINLGLGRIEALLALLGNPQKTEVSGVRFIHIGGTNGKGSTGAMLAAMLTAAGYKTGFFSSPHLHSYCERLRIDGRPAPKAAVTRLILGMAEPLAEMERRGLEQPTEFEVSTAAAFRYFAEERVAYAVIEVGLGGEIDSTNVIRPELAVITNVAMDHMAYLGESEAAIARVKAGIIKPGVPVFTAAAGPALAVIEERAAALASPLYKLGEDFAYIPRESGRAGQSFDWSSAVFGKLGGLHIKLLGEHQLANASLAVAAALKLGLSEEAVRRGLAAARWPGRLELIIRENKPETLLDGAHNVAGMQALSRALRQYWPGRRIVAVLGMLADKEREKALGELLPLVERAVICRVPSYRAGDWQSLAGICWEAGVAVDCIEDVAAAVAAGERLADDGQLLLVTGSLYMLAEARAYLLDIPQEIY